MKRIFTRLAAFATIGVALSLTPAATAQGPAGGGAPANTQTRPQRIVIVNIAKVLRDYNKANFLGTEITKKREGYVKQVTALRTQLTEIQKQFQGTTIPEQKKQLEEKARGIQRQIEDIDREAQTELTKLSNDTIVRVYQDIKGVIYDIAKTNSLAMVLCYPAASKAEDENSPQVATLMLQTPALIPFYHDGMDITEVVVKTLNVRAPGFEKKDGDVTTSGATLPATPPKK